jgi:hypothetical protein
MLARVCLSLSLIFPVVSLGAILLQVKQPDETVIRVIIPRGTTYRVEFDKSSTPSPSPSPKPKAKPKPKSVPGREEPSSELSALLSRNCYACHSPFYAVKQGGGFVMFEEAKEGETVPRLKRLSALEWVEIDYSIYSGDMPKFQDALHSDDSDEVRAYANELCHEIYSAVRLTKP